MGLTAQFQTAVNLSVDFNQYFVLRLSSGYKQENNARTDDL